MRHFSFILLFFCFSFFSMAQNVGIGTSSFTPQSPLHVHLNSSSGNVLQLTNSYSGTCCSTVGLSFLSNSGSWTMQNNQTGNLTFQTASGNLSFYTNGYERMQISSNGNIGIGTSPGSYKMHVNGDLFLNSGWLRTSGTYGLYFETYGGGWYMTDYSYIRAFNGKDVYTSGSFNAGSRVYASSSTLAHSSTGLYLGAAGFGFSASGVIIENSSGESGGFQANGNNAYIWSPGDADILRLYDEDGMILVYYFTNSGGYASSDINKKQNIVPVENALDKVLSLDGFTYEFKLQPEEVEKGCKPQKSAGFIAQELIQLMPEAVEEHGEDGLYVNYNAVLPYMVEAMKTQQEMIEQLQQEVQELKAAQNQ